MKEIKEIIESDRSIKEKIDKLYALKKVTSKLPTKPRLKSTTPDADEIKAYGKAMIQYELDHVKATELILQQKQFNGKIEVALDELIRDESGLNDIPEQYRDKVYSKAYSDGHSSGYLSFYYELTELVEIFN